MSGDAGHMWSESLALWLFGTWPLQWQNQAFAGAALGKGLVEDKIP